MTNNTRRKIRLALGLVEQALHNNSKKYVYKHVGNAINEVHRLVADSEGYLRCLSGRLQESFDKLDLGLFEEIKVELSYDNDFCDIVRI
ncbi:MAG: hypothetical protein GY679_01725 [Mycoplasma sp.]|nr:hypothetical protein [Mycoplasma sp.]